MKLGCDDMIWFHSMYDIFNVGIGYGGKGRD